MALWAQAPGRSLSVPCGVPLAALVHSAVLSLFPRLHVQLGFLGTLGISVGPRESRDAVKAAGPPLARGGDVSCLGTVGNTVPALWYSPNFPCPAVHPGGNTTSGR